MRIRECVLVIALVAACGDKKEAPKEQEGHGHEAHVAPHGGEILELGGGAAHLEILHDHEGGSMTVYVLGADLKTPIAVEAPVVNLVTKDGPAAVTLTAIEPGTDGKASAWKGAHAGLKADPWDGRIRVAIGGKTYQSPLEGEGHDHK